jgi:hypothetical protein
MFNKNIHLRLSKKGQLLLCLSSKERLAYGSTVARCIRRQRPRFNNCIPKYFFKRAHTFSGVPASSCLQQIIYTLGAIMKETMERK